MADEPKAPPTRPRGPEETGPELEPYPSLRRDDAVELFESDRAARQDGFRGPQGDPAEGKP